MRYHRQLSMAPASSHVGGAHCLPTCHLAVFDRTPSAAAGQAGTGAFLTRFPTFRYAPQVKNLCSKITGK